MKTKVFLHDTDGDVSAYVSTGTAPRLMRHPRRQELVGFYWDADDPEQRGPEYITNRAGYAFLTAEVTTDRGTTITWYASIHVAAETWEDTPEGGGWLTPWSRDRRRGWLTGSGPRPTGQEWERAKAAAQAALLPFEQDMLRVLTAGATR